MKNIQSLHSHTLLSDGTQTHEQVLDMAKKYGISTIAFTDHDSLPDLDTINMLKGLNHDVKWLLGIELTAGLPKELGGWKEDTFHLLGLFVDPTNKALLDHCQKYQQQRMDWMKQTVKNFQELGFDITEDDCRKTTTGSSVGQPHVVKALKSKEKNIKLMDEYKEKMRKLAENDAYINERYQIMVQQGEKQYPYTLFLKDDAPFPAKAGSFYGLDFDEAVKLIREAGGITSIAHYTTAKKNFSPDQLEKVLRENRLDGMEVVFGFWGYGNDEERPIEEDRKLVRELVKKYNKISTGGGDTHFEQDFINFATNSWYCDETEGMVESILEKKPELDLTWSTL